MVTDFVLLSAVDDASPSKPTTCAQRLGADQLNRELNNSKETLHLGAGGYGMAKHSRAK